MPIPGLLDILSQGGQFLSGRQAGQRDRAAEDERRRQTAALEQALLEQRQAQAEHSKALAERALNPPEVEVNWQLYHDPVLGPVQVDPRSGTFRKIEGLTSPPKDEDPRRTGFQPNSGALMDLDTGEQIAPGAPSATATAAAGRTTAQQRTAGMLYTSGKSGYETLERVLAEADRESPGWLEQQSAKLPFGVGNMVATPFVRQMNQAANQLSDAWLRLTSGAAVPEPEVARFAAGFLPLAGDDPLTAQNKRQARATIMEAMRAAAGANLDVASGIQSAGIDPADFRAVAAWVEQNVGGGAAPAAGGADLGSSLQQWYESQQPGR